jgi:hypothetical protein
MACIYLVFSSHSHAYINFQNAFASAKISVLAISHALTKADQRATYTLHALDFSLLLAEVGIPQATIAITEPRILFLHGNKSILFTG